MNWPAGEAALVTGAASGIGLGMARALVAAGAKVALADIDGERVAAAVQELTDAGGTVVGVSLDVTDPDQWVAAADKAEAALGPISILCNNAGLSGGKEIDRTTLDVWRWVYRVNVEAQFIGVSVFLPRFKARGGRCHIVNTASMAGIVPMQRVGAYSSAKFASFSFSMILRDELKGTGIGVSVLCPGTVATRIAVNSGEREAELLGQDADSAAIEGNFALTSQGADPDRVGDQVVEAMQKGQFLIITHRDWEPLVTAVHTEIRQAFAECDDRHGPDVSARYLVQGFNPVAE
ncbi:SDR family oxidoreductase [Sphingopyxis sp.]|uniref:SDR family NAD(P)-dependent oxidoreductase n=1 Tax=Sphingopyxis sp. TaxID=1908224 RepID=UPI00263077A0|nr:SDR family oxidoreductase [Sphingopyxis sp.]MCW0200099.1 SDR family oxidoreductase [Sphingopyxis sp.]